MHRANGKLRAVSFTVDGAVFDDIFGWIHGIGNGLDRAAGLFILTQIMRQIFHFFLRQRLSRNRSS